MQVGADAGRDQLGITHLAMGGVGGVQHAGAGIGHMGGNLPQLQVLHERLGPGAATGHAESSPRRSCRLAGTSAPARTPHRSDREGWRTQVTFGCAAKCSATALAVLRMPGHAQVQALQPQIDEERVLGALDGAQIGASAGPWPS